MLYYFPAVSDIKPSEASPKIWAGFESFTAAQLNLKAASSLLKAAKMIDQNALIIAFKKMAESCESCHKTHRLK